MALIRRIVSQAIDGCTFTARRDLIKGMRVRGGGSAFLPEGMWPRWQESAETRFLRSLDLRGNVIYDIGALHGHMTMFFAGQARHVIAYEANPASANRIKHNLRVNGIANVRVRNVAVGDHRGALEFTLDPDRPALSSGNPALANRSKRRRSNPGPGRALG